MRQFTNPIHILRLIDGAKEARGLTVIIDVFRAFSLECYLYDRGVKEIRPVGSIEEAFALKNSLPDSLLVGERQGKKCEGFDFGNSPSSIPAEQIKGKTIIHTTSAGTQGIVNATHASELLTGSLVNAKAIADYIIEKQPEEVSLVCMGTGGTRPNAEDELCAQYIKSLLEGSALPDIEEKIRELRFHGGEHFFNEETQEVFPQEDFLLCCQYDRFPFVIRIQKDAHGYVTEQQLL